MALDTSTVSGNTAGYRGGINNKALAADDADPLARTLIVANTAGVSGGGIRLEGVATVCAQRLHRDYRWRTTR